MEKIYFFIFFCWDLEEKFDVCIFHMKLESKFKSAFLEVLHMNPNKLSIQHEKDLILHEKCVKKEKLSNTRHIKKKILASCSLKCVQLPLPTNSCILINVENKQVCRSRHVATPSRNSGCGERCAPIRCLSTWPERPATYVQQRWAKAELVAVRVLWRQIWIWPGFWLYLMKIKAE